MGSHRDDAPRHDRPPALAGRERLVGRVRATSLAVLLSFVVVAVGASWVGASALARSATRDLDAAAGDDLARDLAVLHLAVGAALAAGAVGLSRRSTRVVESVFHHEDRLVRTLAHEVRSPLARVLATTEEGLGGDRPADEALRVAAADGRALSELIDDLVELARVLPGAQPLPDEVVALDELLAGLADRLPRRVAVEVRAEPVVVVGSPRLLRLAVVNLVRNAAHHAYAGRAGVVEVRVDDRGIAVLDRGPGVPPARLAELRRDVPRGLRRCGAGLGLPLAGWVAEAHGGGLDLRNRDGGGFEARLVLPVAPAPAPRAVPEGRAGRHLAPVGVPPVPRPAPVPLLASPSVALSTPGPAPGPGRIHPIPVRSR